MRVLDLSAGNRAMWFDKHNPVATFVDIRSEVEPDIVADSRNLPGELNGYDLVVFDPPHVNCGPNGIMSQTYGHHTSEEIRAIVRDTARSAHRATRQDALMAFKWNDHDQKLDKVLALMAEWWEPLFGQRVATRTKHASGTYWVMLLRRAPNDTSQANPSPKSPEGDPYEAWAKSSAEALRHWNEECAENYARLGRIAKDLMENVCPECESVIQSGINRCPRCSGE